MLNIDDVKLHENRMARVFTATTLASASSLTGIINTSLTPRVYTGGFRSVEVTIKTDFTLTQHKTAGFNTFFIISRL